MFGVYVVDTLDVMERIVIGSLKSWSPPMVERMTVKRTTGWIIGTVIFFGLGVATGTILGAATGYSGLTHRLVDPTLGLEDGSSLVALRPAQ